MLISMCIDPPIRLHANGQHWVPIIDPAIAHTAGVAAYEEGKSAGVFIRDRTGEFYLSQVQLWQGVTSQHEGFTMNTAIVEYQLTCIPLGSSASLSAELCTCSRVHQTLTKGMNPIYYRIICNMIYSINTLA